MDGARLASRIGLGFAKMAEAAGEWADFFRPQNGDEVFAAGNRLARRKALILPPQGWRMPPQFGEAAFLGYFGREGLGVGDLLRTAAEAFFIGALPPLAPALLIRANGRFTLARPRGGAGFGASAYGGVVRPELAVLARDWPAHLALGAPLPSPRASEIPMEGRLAAYTLLWPRHAEIVPQPSDLVFAASEAGSRVRQFAVAGVAVEAEGVRLGLREVMG
jgi:hypothetical protein